LTEKKGNLILSNTAIMGENHQSIQRPEKQNGQQFQTLAKFSHFGGRPFNAATSLSIVHKAN